MRALLDMGYVGFDLPIAPGAPDDFASKWGATNASGKRLMMPDCGT
jgi:hypothetical protein